MLDKALETISNNESYYFQLYPLSLAIANPDCELPAAGTNYRFTILRGQQKFDETRLPIESTFRSIGGRHVMVMPKCPVNFYVPSYSKGRGAEFTFNMYQTENKTEYFIAEHAIDVEPYVSAFKADRTVRFEHTTPFSDDYHLEYEVYVERSRIALEKVVREYKNERSLKSPLRERPPVPEAPPARRPLAGQAKQEEEKEAPATQLPSNRTESRGSSVRSREAKQTGSASKPAASTSRTEDREEDKEEEKKERKEETAGQPFVKKPSQVSEVSDRKEVAHMNVQYRAVTKKDSEIHMTGSQRLAQTGITEVPEVQKVASSEEARKRRDKLVMAVFLLVSAVFMYISMHPNRRA